MAVQPNLEQIKQRRRQLVEALLSAFPDWGSLEGMVFFGLGQNLSTIVGQHQSLAVGVAELVAWAEAQSRLADLVAAARDANPGNRELRALTENGLSLADWQALDALYRTPPPCPYPGMMPFEAKDARFFYGREREIDEMLARLRTEHFQLVIGPSGSGKSSLLAAGVLARLPTCGYWPADYWRVLQMRPGAEPNAELRRQLRGEPVPATVDALLKEVGAQRFLLVVDQFEELFAQAAREEQTTFLATIEQLCALERCVVVPAMRADFYPDLMASQLWPLAEGRRLEVAPLAGERLREAIVEPAEAVGVELEPALAERLLADAADEPGSLPMLQETLVLLWPRMSRRLLAASAYESMSEGGRSGLAVAIARKADSTFAALSKEQQVIAHRIFLRSVQFGEGRPDTRRRQPVAALRAEGDDPLLFAGTLAALTASRLLVLGGEGKPAAEQTADIAHDTLIRNWPALQTWIRERRVAEQTRRRLEDKALDWERFGRKAGLLDEAELAEAERWLEQPDALEVGYSVRLKELAATSRAAIDEVAREQENRRQRELDQQREIAEQAEARRRDAQRNWRRLAFATLGLLILLVITAILGFRADQLHGETQRQLSLLRQSRARALAALSVGQLDEDPELGVLLAMESVSVTATLEEPVVPEAEEALHHAILRSRLVKTLREHIDTVQTANCSPDGRRIVTASRDGTAKVWDIMTGQVVQVLQPATGWVLSARYSHDGKRIVTASGGTSGAGGSATVWDAENGQKVATLGGRNGHSDLVWDASFSRQDWRVVTASWDRTAKIWDVGSNELLITLGGNAKGHKQGLWRATYSPDGRRIITASDDRTAKIWDLQSGQVVMTVTHLLGGVLSAEYSPDGRTIVTADPDWTAKIWNTETGKVQGVLHGHSSAVEYASYSADGQLIVTGSWDHTAIVWSATRLQPLFTLGRHQDRVHYAAFCRDDNLVVTASSDGTAKIWNTHGGEEAPALHGEAVPLTHAEYSRDGRFALTTSTAGSTKIWHSDSGLESGVPISTTEWVTYATFSPDDRFIASAMLSGRVAIRDAKTGEEQFEIAHKSSTWSVAYSPDGRRLITASEDNTVKVWDARSGQPLHTVTAHEGPVRSAYYSPDGRYVLSAGFDGTARVWDTTTWRERFPAIAHGPRVHQAVYSPDGRLIITASDDKTAKVWDAVTGKEVYTLTGHNAVVRSVAFSPDGRYVATASFDGTAKLWDTKSWQSRATLGGNEGPLNCISFSQDSRLVIVAGRDGSARQYLVNVQDLLALAQTRVSRSLTVEERRLHLGEP